MQDPMDSGVPALKMPHSKGGRLFGPTGHCRWGILAMEGRDLAEAELDLKRHSVSPIFSPALRWGKLRLSAALYWNGLRRAACGLILRVSAWPKLDKLK